MKVGVVGVGYWGKNIIRNLVKCGKVDKIYVYDRDRGKVDLIKSTFPNLISKKSFEELLDSDINSVFIITSPESHFELGLRVLESGKHLYLEKPFVLSSENAKILLEKAKDKNLNIMSGHTFLYSPPVRKIKEIIDSGEIGKIEFISFRRINLGIHRKDVNVVWDLLPHDLSMLFFWLGFNEEIKESKVFLKKTVGKHPDVAFVLLKFSNGVMGEGIVSWLSPRKIRENIIVGRKKMIVYNDTEAEEKIKIYDKKVEKLDPSDFGEYQLTYRVGDIIIPSLETYEPLSIMVKDFIESIEDGRKPVSNGYLGFLITRTIEKILKDEV